MSGSEERWQKNWENQTTKEMWYDDSVRRLPVGEAARVLRLTALRTVADYWNFAKCLHEIPHYADTDRSDIIWARKDKLQKLAEGARAAMAAGRRHYQDNEAAIQDMALTEAREAGVRVNNFELGPIEQAELMVRDRNGEFMPHDTQTEAA